MTRARAHRDGKSGPDHWLVEHLREVARRSAEFARRLRPGDELFILLAQWSGLLHDLGKYRQRFQLYLDGKLKRSEETQHAVFGAAALHGRLSRAVALVINGHHAGLHDFDTLQQRLNDPELKPIEAAKELLRDLESDLLSTSATLPTLVDEFIHRDRSKDRRFRHSHEVLVRVLFSCLVDADFLDTERYMQGVERTTIPWKPGVLLERVIAFADQKQAKSDGSELGRIRSQIFDACLRAAANPPGFAALTAPTGGGKTLAGLAYALEHAEKHKLDRVIVVLPFLSIIEQNARVYRDVLGDDVVVEHHSAVVRPETDSNSEQRSQSELATENWDAPIIVTTAVQFLESLFARKPSRCRKLHRIARSVVVLDEFHTLPHQFLEPILNVFRCLRDDWSVSFLFMSATRPRFPHSRHLVSGFRENELQETGPDPARLFGTLNRVRYEIPPQAWSLDELAEQLLGQPQVLAVLNLRRQAQRLYDILKAKAPEGLFHLSSTMCAQHRSDLLGGKESPQPDTIHHALANGKTCRVISTQVIEAGVDIDFPVVFRLMGPLDAIIQAAGRCNREGKLSLTSEGLPGGLVVVFQLTDEKFTPPGLYRDATNLTREFLAEIPNAPDRLSTDPNIFGDYHERLIAADPTDLVQRDRDGRKGKTIQELRANFSFEQVADLFQVIADTGVSIVVPYGKAPTLLEGVASSHRPPYIVLQELQRYIVNIYDCDLKVLGASVQPIQGLDGMLQLLSPCYDDRIGVRLGELPPDSFACF